MNNKSNITAIGSALGAAFFWSFSFIWFKVANKAYDPVTIVIFRLFLAAVFITTTAFFIGRLQTPARKHIKLFLLLALFEPFIYFLGESYGLKHVSSTVGGVIISTIPLFSPLAAWYFYREKLKPMNIAGLLFSFVGVGFVVLNSSFGLSASPLGVGLLFIAVFAAVGYSIVLKDMVMRYNALTIIAYQNIIGVIYFLPIWLFVDFGSFISKPLDYGAIKAIILLAVFSSTFAFLFFTYSIRKIGITRTNIFINMIPVFVAVFSYFMLNEVLNLQKIAGIIIVVTGLFLTQLKRKPKKEEQ